MSVVSVVCCQVEISASDHLSGGVPPHVLCMSDISKLRERRGRDQNTGRSAIGRKREI
jgi:hypothetical protein